MTPISSPLAAAKVKYRSQLLPFYNLYRRCYLCHPVRTWYHKRRLLSKGSVNGADRELLRGMKSRISAHDGMYRGRGEHYYAAALSAVHSISEALLAAGKKDVSLILDLPCGYGRVLRALRGKYPRAHVTACDLERAGVDFCARTFDAEPAYSKPKFADLNLQREYDLIWCGSLVTHLPLDDTIECLRFFRRHLAPGGILVVTCLGHYAKERLQKEGGAAYRLSDDAALSLLAALRETGHGFADYPRATPGYGLAVMTPEWLRRQIEGIDGWREVYFEPRRWDHHQDVFGIQRVE